MSNRTSIFYLIGFFVLLAACDKDEPFDPYVQLEKDQEKITDYLGENNITAEADSIYGIRFVIHEQGDGDKPKVSDRINLDYAGRLLSNGSEFDANDSIEFRLSDLIAGWQIVLPYVNEGGSVTMYVPSGYAYGHYGSGPIPGDASLIFDVTINSIK